MTRRPVKPEEDALWKKVTKTVRPIAKPKPVGLGNDGTQEPHKVFPGAKGERVSAPQQKSHLPKPKPVDSHHTHKTPELTGIDRATSQKLRRGRYEVDGTLDLHGMKQFEAKRTLTNFLVSAHAQGHRCVLVITGKGKTGDQPQRRSAGFMDRSEPGVLKRRVPEWLREGHLRTIVTGIQQAGQRQGGEGALYVMLKSHG